MLQTVNINFTINKRKFAFQMTHDPNSLIDRDMMICIRNYGCPEPEIVHLMTRVLRPGDFAIDGGANVGFFTNVMAQLVDINGIVLAVEPGENNLFKLRDNLKLNKLTNFEICNRPLWSSNENVFLHYHEHGGLNSLGCQAPMMGKKEMEGITLNTWYTTPRLIKLDIEGAEEHALRGASKHLADHVPYIICELNQPALKALGSSQESLRRFMREWGYSAFILFRDGQLPCLVPDKTTIFEAEESNGTVNVLFSTVEAVSNAWPRAVLSYA